MTSKDLPGLGVVDDVIPEPLGGAHRDHYLMASRLKMYLRSKLRELTAIDAGQLVEQRYQKFRRMGVFLERLDEQVQHDGAADASALTDSQVERPDGNGRASARASVDSTR